MPRCRSQAITVIIRSPAASFRAHEKYLDGQFRQLQLYVDKGLDAPLPPGGSPGPFRATFCGLPFSDDSFVSDGHLAYGHRIETLAEATVESWRSVQA
jgi:hypothetical protein